MTGFFKHPTAIVESEHIGACTRIWAFTHVMEGARLGRNCNIGEHCYLENHVVVGDEVVIKNGVALWEGLELGDRVFIGPNAVFTNDLLPRSKAFNEAAKTRVHTGASIGANATILCGIEIGQHALIGAGAVVTRDVPDFGVVFGNPARLRGYICCCGKKLVWGDGNRSFCPCGVEFSREDGKVLMVAGARAELQESRPWA